jgi:hypothetical protein
MTARYFMPLTVALAITAAGSVAGEPALTAITSSTTSAADPAAHDLLKAAHDSRATFAGAFAGIDADVTFDDNGTVYKGKAVYNTKGDTTLTAPDLKGDDAEWLDDQVGSLFGHRRGGDFDKGDGANPISFGPDDHSPLGRMVVLHDGLNSSYRVQDKQVTEVTRTMGDERFTITVLETTRTESGKYLPRQFMVTYFDAKTGAIKRAQAFTDAYAKTDGIWTPLSRRVITAENGGFTTRTLTFSNIHVRKD